MRLILKYDIDDWYTIEKAEHENRTRIKQIGKNSFSFMDSARISNACVEGTGEEMIAIARAIENRTGVAFKRCAVFFADDGVHFWSPRNSRTDGVVTVEEADDLAKQILATLAA